MFKSVPPGIEVFTKAPKDVAAFEAAVLTCEAAFDAVLVAVSTALLTVEVLRLANQSSAPIRSTARTTGHNHFGVLTVRASSANCDAREVTLESPGIESPDGRKLRRLGSSEASILPSPLAVSPWLLTFDASVPKTIGAAAARILPADGARMPENSAILLWMPEMLLPKSMFNKVVPACDAFATVDDPPPAAAPIALAPRVVKPEIRFMI
jgi:hypothetical protein